MHRSLAFALLLLVSVSAAVSSDRSVLAADGNANTTSTNTDDRISKGEVLFKKNCSKCHSIGPSAQNKRRGPHLNNIVGSRAASREGYKYSRAMKRARKTGLRWNMANLDAFLEKPKRFVPKNRMKFSGLEKPEDRAALITFLKSHTKGANPHIKWEKSRDTDPDPEL